MAMNGGGAKCFLTLFILIVLFHYLANARRCPPYYLADGNKISFSQLAECSAKDGGAPCGLLEKALSNKTNEVELWGCRDDECLCWDFSCGDCNSTIVLETFK